MTVKDVADHLRVKQRTVYRLALERKLFELKGEASRRFNRSDIDGSITAQSAIPSAGDGLGEKLAR